jgi:hypothetical protein
LKADTGHTRARGVLVFGVTLWVAAFVARWPVAVSFADEVGYVGQMRLVLGGSLRPSAESTGVWVRTAHGAVAKFPYLVPIVLAPLFAVAPRLIFLSGIVAALAIVLVASRVLRSWGRNPAWALLTLAHPTVVLIARTTMTDLILAAAALGAWWSLRRERPLMAPILLGAVVAIKAVGFFLVAALLVGELIRARVARRASGGIKVGRLIGAASGILAGLAFTLLMNLAATGKLWFAYSEAHQFLGTPSFWPPYFLTSAPAHLSSLFLVPPLLLLGIRPFWRRSEFGPVLLIGGLVLLMSFYFFVDHGRSRVETLIMSPRLILPAVVFLLVGYADETSGLCARFRETPLAAYACATVPAFVCLALSVRHLAWQKTDAVALKEATMVAAREGAAELGLTDSAAKAGILYPGPVSFVQEGLHEPKVVLCNTQSSSYRKPSSISTCALAGYDDREERSGFHVLVRRDPLP